MRIKAKNHPKPWVLGDRVHHVDKGLATVIKIERFKAGQINYIVLWLDKGGFLRVFSGSRRGWHAVNSPTLQLECIPCSAGLTSNKVNPAHKNPPFNFDNIPFPTNTQWLRGTRLHHSTLGYATVWQIRTLKSGRVDGWVLHLDNGSYIRLACGNRGGWHLVNSPISRCDLCVNNQADDADNPTHQREMMEEKHMRDLAQKRRV